MTKKVFGWIAAHPQRVLGFAQVTLSQVAMWDFLSPKVAAGMVGAAGLFQVWTAFANSSGPPQSPPGGEA